MVIAFERAKLYEEIWTEPLTKLGKITAFQPPARRCRAQALAESIKALAGC